MNPSDIKNLIISGLKDCTALVDGDGRHFQATVISPEFHDKSRIEKQQLVFKTLGDRVDNGEIHAISIKAFTPEEWTKLNES